LGLSIHGDLVVRDVVGYVYLVGRFWEEPAEIPVVYSSGEFEP